MAWGKGFADVIRRGRSEQIFNIRDLLMTEYRDRLDWQLLQQIAGDLSQPEDVRSCRGSGSSATRRGQAHCLAGEQGKRAQPSLILGTKIGHRLKRLGGEGQGTA